MTELTRKVKEAVKKVNPNLIISISPNHPSFAYKKYSQNWLVWVRQKLVDEVIVQIYRRTKGLTELATLDNLKISQS